MKKQLLPLVVMAVVFQGCASSRQNNKRLERYQPVVAHRTYEVTKKAEPKKVTKAKQQKPVEVKPVAVAATKSDSSVDGQSGKVQRMRKLKHGDMVTVCLYGIPEQVEVNESIDNFGRISMPLIGEVEIVGVGTSAAERSIRDAYINSGFYTDLSVVVMAMADEYFIRGEVKKVGNYPLIGDRTLLQAITAAGGYTDFAKLSKVTVLRLNKDPMVFNCHRIAKRQDADPLIHPGDIINVPRRILWK